MATEAQLDVVKDSGHGSPKRFRRARENLAHSMLQGYRASNETACSKAGIVDENFENHLEAVELVETSIERIPKPPLAVKDAQQADSWVPSGIYRHKFEFQIAQIADRRGIPAVFNFVHVHNLAGGLWGRKGLLHG